MVKFQSRCIKKSARNRSGAAFLIRFATWLRPLTKTCMFTRLISVLMEEVMLETLWERIYLSNLSKGFPAPCKMTFGDEIVCFIWATVKCCLATCTLSPSSHKVCTISEFFAFLCDELMFLWCQTIEGHWNNMLWVVCIELFYIRCFKTIVTSMKLRCKFNGSILRCYFLTYLMVVCSVALC